MCCAVPASFRRRLTYLQNFVNGCDEVLAGRSLSRKLIGARYIEELPALDRDAVRKLRNSMDDYRRACFDVLLNG